MQQNNTESISGKQKALRLVAGADSKGQPVFETVEVIALEDKPGYYQLGASPLLLRNLARGDIFKVDLENPADIRVEQRSGNIAVRVFARQGLELLEQKLTPEVEKLGGTLDIATPRGLSYSLHVNIGFSAIENLFDGIMAEYLESVWYYGNVYDPVDGITPLNWWDQFINQV